MSTRDAVHLLRLSSACFGFGSNVAASARPWRRGTACEVARPYALVIAAALVAALVASTAAHAAVLDLAQVVKKETDGIEGLAGVLSIAVSPDGAYVYTAAPGDDAVAVFARDAATGTLRFVETQKDGVGGVDGLGGATAVTLSPDGASAYVTGERDGAVAVFRRNPRSGALTFVERHDNASDGIAGLTYARAVAVSPDGRNVYVAGQSDNAVVVFMRNTTTGGLTYVEAEIDGLGGVDGLTSAVAVAVSPDGRFVYAAGLNDNAVAVFRRSAATGALTFIEVLKEGVESFGIRGAHTVAISPDGAHVYVAGQSDDSIAAFRRTPSPACSRWRTSTARAPTA